MRSEDQEHGVNNTVRIRKFHNDKENESIEAHDSKRCEENYVFGKDNDTKQIQNL